MKKFQTILVPIDFSPLGEEAIATAQRLARRFGSALHLAHVHEFPYDPGPLAPLPLSLLTYRDEVATRRSRRLRMLAKRHGLSPANCHFLDGTPIFREICRLAQTIAADLIVMPTHGYTGMNRFLSGSIAERIVQHAPCPVLVTRQPGKSSGRLARPAMASLETILVPVDFSPASLGALQFAIEFAAQTAARLLIFHASPLGDAFTADGFGMYDLSVLEESIRAGAEKEMKEFVAPLKFRRVRFETIVKTVPAVAGICDLAEERKVDLIITATHGLTGFKHLLIGSVAERVARHARRPVLVIPSHPAERRASLRRVSAPPAAPNVSPALKSRSLRGPSATKRKRKLQAHALPERRLTNRFRESQAIHSTS